MARLVQQHNKATIHQIVMKKQNSIMLYYTVFIISMVMFSCDLNIDTKSCLDFNILNKECFYGKLNNENIRFKTYYIKNRLNYIVCLHSYYDTVYFSKFVYSFKEKSTNGVSPSSHFIYCKKDTVFCLRIEFESNPNNEQFVEFKIYNVNSFTILKGTIKDTTNVNDKLANLNFYRFINNVDTVYKNEVNKNSLYLLSSYL